MVLRIRSLFDGEKNHVFAGEDRYLVTVKKLCFFDKRCVLGGGSKKNWCFFASKKNVQLTWVPEHNWFNFGSPAGCPPPSRSQNKGLGNLGGGIAKIEQTVLAQKNVFVFFLTNKK